MFFEEKNPFPLKRPGEVKYQDEQQHSALVDEWLGFRVQAVEAALAKAHAGYQSARDAQHWIGLPAQTLQTPYSEIRYMLSLLNLQSGDRVVDLGAGYGRMGLVIARHYPEVSFLGYEVVRERVEEGRRVFAEHANESSRLECADLTLEGFELARAEIYFIYDYGSREAIAKTLEDLKIISMTKSITVIGRGRASRDEIERRQPWLSQVNEPEHHGNFSIYRS